MKTGKCWTVFSKENINGLAMFLDTMDFCMEIVEGRMRGIPIRGRRRIQMLHGLANDDGHVALKGLRRTEGCRQRKDVTNLLYSRRLLMMIYVAHTNSALTAFWIASSSPSCVADICDCIIIILLILILIILIIMCQSLRLVVFIYFGFSMSPCF